MDKELTERIDANYRAIAALTDQVAQLVRERDELQKQVWLYEKNGVTCQTYRHTVKQSCSECNVQMDYNTTPPQPEQEPIVCPYCKNSATLGAVYYDQNCLGCVKRMTVPPYHNATGLD